MTEAEWDDCVEPYKMFTFLGDRASPRKRRLCAAACCRRVWHLFPCDGCREAVRCVERYADGLIDEGERDEVNRRALDAVILFGAAADALSCGSFTALDSLPENERDRYEDIYQRVYDEWRRAGGDAGEAWEASAAARAAHQALAGGEYWHSAVYFAAKAVAHGCGGPRDEAADPPDDLTRDASQRFWDDQPLAEAYVSADPDESARQCDLIADLFGDFFRPVALAPTLRTPTVTSLARAAYDERHLPGGELDPFRLSILADAMEESGAPDEIVSHLRSPGPHVRGCWAIDLCLGLG